METQLTTTPVVSKETRKLFVMSEAIKQHIANIRDKTGIGNDSDAIRYAITICSKELNPPEYIQKKQSSSPRQKYDTPEDRLKNKIQKDKEEQVARTAVEYEYASGLCKILNGKIIDNNNGTFGCDYVLYEKVGKRVLEGKRTVPFDLLTQEHVDGQYKGGTQEEVLAILHPEPLLKK